MRVRGTRSQILTTAGSYDGRTMTVI
jgi:hypothetical protein